MAKVQISEELFIELCKYHLLGMGADENAIQKALSEKMDAILMRQLYSKSKNQKLSEADREKARLEYLDKRGISTKFRF